MHSTAQEQHLHTTEQHVQCTAQRSTELPGDLTEIPNRTLFSRRAKFLAIWHASRKQSPTTWMRSPLCSSRKKNLCAHLRTSPRAHIPSPLVPLCPGHSVLRRYSLKHHSFPLRPQALHAWAREHTEIPKTIPGLLCDQDVNLCYSPRRKTQDTGASPRILCGPDVNLCHSLRRRGRDTGR